MRNFLIYDGKSSLDFGIWAALNRNDNAPKRVMQDIVVPGRNGTLTIDGGRYENIEVSYQCFIKEGFEQFMPMVRNYFLSRTGYKRLEDSAHPDEFRLAKYKSGLDVTVSQMRKQGYFTLTFDCMPQRYLKSGEVPVVFTRSGSIYNETLQIAKPLIRVYGEGQLRIGGSMIALSHVTNYIDIDCESMDAYYGAENKNANVFGVFPVLNPGENSVVPDFDMTKVEIIPRWWIL